MKKNILKIAGLFAITFALIFGFNFNAEAITWTEYSGETGIPYSSAGLTLEGNGAERISRAYYVSGGVADERAFCLDAQYESNISNLVPVNPVLSGETLKAYKAGLISIYTNNFGGQSEAELYLTKMLAVRTWSYAFGVNTSSDGEYKYALIAGIKLSNSLVNEFSNTASFKTLSSAGIRLSQQNVPTSANGDFTYRGDNALNAVKNYFAKALDAAAEYVQNSNNSKKANIKTQVKPDLNIKNENGRLSTNVVHTITLENVKAGSNFTISKGSVNYSYGLQFTSSIPSSLVAHISEIKINGVTIASNKDEVLNLLGKNLIEGHSESTITIDITAHFEGNEEDLKKNCAGKGLSYSIKGLYNETSTTLSTSNYDIQFWRSKDSVGYQTYITLIPTDDTDTNSNAQPWESSDTVSLVENCENPCEDLEKKCLNGDEAACKEYIDKDCPNDCTILDQVCDKDNIDPEFEEACKDYDKVCPKDECDTLRQDCGEDIHADTEACEKYREVCFPSLADYTCDTYISGLTCCDKDNNLIIGEEDNVPVNIVGPGPLNEDEPNLKLCFVDKVDNVAKFLTNENLDSVSDQNGNTYTFDGTKSNPYCTVSCKEDYMMQMPAAKKVNAGRYFTFKASINGTKACFTNSIDHDKFIKDITKLQNELIEASNNYQKYKALADGVTKAIYADYVSSCSCSGCTCDEKTDKYIEKMRFEGLATNMTKKVEVRLGEFTLEKYSEIVSESFEYEKKNGESTSTTSDTVCSDPKDSNTCRDCDASCTSWTISEPECDVACLRTKLAGKRDSYKSAMDNLNIEVKNLITLFNQCSSWTTAVKFDPKVRYEYQEKDYMQMLIDDKLTDNMEKYGNTTSGVSSWFCNYDEFVGDNPAFAVTINDDYTKCIGSNALETGGIVNIGNNIINTDNSSNNDSNETRENIFIGDSRTYYLFQQINELTQDNTIACSGRGYGWFSNNGQSEASDLPCVPGSNPYGGISSLKARLDSAKKYNVVVWLGVNDLGTDRLAGRTPETMADLYIEQYKKLLNEHDNIDIYVVSVGPVNELGETYGQTNAIVEAFNAELRKKIGSTPRLNYIDVYNTVVPEYNDGLHYEGQTNQRYYQAITNGLKGDTINKVENDDVTFDRQSEAKYRDFKLTQCAADTGCGNEINLVSNAKYKRLESSTKASYRPKTLFYNAHADGTISTKQEENSDALENALPVALSRSRGIWRYDVIMKDLGEFYETGTLGRYAGDDPKSLTNGELDYACVYLVNIQKENLTCDFNKTCTDDCVTECKGPNCDVDICEGGNCTTDCLSVGCIYDSKDGSSIYSREVSLNNFLYNGTTSYNWDADANAKAKRTVEEIQNRADDVYSGVDKDTDQAILSVKITPSSASKIRETVNDSLSLRCESLTINGVEYTNTACYSRFIDDILDGEYNIVNEDNSYISDENNRRQENYFKPWNGTIDDKQMLGPSWK